MLTELERPTEQAEHYRFFRNSETGRHWKVKLEFRDARQPMVDGAAGLAPAEFNLVVSASPTDNNGKALRDSSDRAIVGDSHTHVFTAVETSAADFDVRARVMSIVTERIAEGESKFAAVADIKNFVAGWQSGAALQANPTSPNEKEKSNA